MTSHDVVARLRRILKTKKIGHAGTLDPLATGVLPMLINKGTKLSQKLMEHDKTYIATIQFGIKTDTGDITGKAINNVGAAVHGDPIECLNTFLGEIQQIPPMYSAIKINGKKLYEYAREGITIEREPRKITIYKIELINFNEEKQELTIKVECSKGTYIRVLAEDIAEKLGTVGTIKELERTVVGNFKIEDAIKLDELEKMSMEDIEKHVIKKESTTI